MINKLQHIFDDHNRYFVLGISSINNVLEYQLLQILFKKDELKIEKRIFSNNLDDNFKAHLKKDYPVILHLEGDNIINKVVENKTGYRKSIIFKADPNDFYFYEYHQNNNVFVSVIRKHIVEDSIALLKTLNLFTVNVSFGPFILSSLLPVIKAYTYSSISSSNYTIEIKDNEIQSFNNKPSSKENLIINDEALSQRETPLMAAFLNYKYPNESIDFDTSFLGTNKSEFKFKKWFKIAGIFTLVFFLISIFISSLLLKTYLEKLAEKESTYALSQETIMTINRLKEEKVLKEKILQTSGANLKNFITKYISDIGNSVPQGVTLNTIHSIPTLKKIKPSEKINFDFSSIKITGENINDNTFNLWVKKLKTYTWVKKLDIIDYTQESKSINSFIIKIKI